jgi:hypothetical protein
MRQRRLPFLSVNHQTHPALHFDIPRRFVKSFEQQRMRAATVVSELDR